MKKQFSCSKSFLRHGDVVCGECGVSSLMFAMVSLGAMGFLALYFNLASYISAQSTVDAAANAVMRCLIPTDADCVEYLETPQEKPLFDWYGYAVGDGGETETEVWLSEMDYSASMNQRTWSAQYTSYQSHWQQRQVAYDTYIVPEKEFRPVYSRYVTKTGDDNKVRFKKRDVHYRPSHSFLRHFPGFETNESAHWSSWLRGEPLYSSLDEPINEISLSPGEVREIQHVIQIPLLPEIAPNISCIDNNESDCDVAALAGGDGDSKTWQHTAYLALKVFAQIKAKNGTASAKWGRDDEDAFSRAGLWVDVYDGNGNKLRTECLGGRVYSQAVDGDEWQGYNLWTRGPAGAHGGNSDGVCPGGDTSHDNIAVPRGGKAIVRAYLKAHESYSPLLARVNFAWFFDNYLPVEKTEFVEADCEEVYLPGELESECIEAAQCGLSAVWETVDSCVTRRLDGEGVITTAVCERGPDSIEIAEVKPLVSYRAAVCEDAWHIDPSNKVVTSPEEFVAVAKDLNRAKLIAGVDVKVCGWEETRKELEVGSIPDNCSASAPQARIHACQDAPMGEVGEVDECRGISELRAKWQRVARDLNIKQSKLPREAVSFPENEIEFDWSDITNDRWEDSWTIPMYNGRPIEGEALRVVSDNELRDEQHWVRQFERKILPKWEEPNSRDFIAAVKAEGGKKGGSWEEYLRNFDENIRVVDKGVTKASISSVYPFIEPVYEIYWGSVLQPPVYDFNRDGIADAECHDEHRKYSGLDEMLREFAAKQFAEANEKNEGGEFVYAFEGEGLQSKMKFLGAFRGQPKLELGSCAPTRTNKRTTPRDGDKMVYLGRSAERPIACDDGTFFYCSSVSNETNVQLGETIMTTDYKAAIERGAREIRAVFPQAHFAEKCLESDGRCFSIRIDDEDSYRTKVLLSYNVPLSFPLDKLLNSKTISVYSLKEEIRQLETVNNLVQGGIVR